MNIAERSGRFISSFLKSFGPSNIKRVLWDKEFSGTKWNFMDDTSADCVYPILEKYTQKGDILDLGCGPGNTANEMAISSYRSYVGVDISEAALAKGVKRTKDCGREEKNSFACSDFLSYMPQKDFDVILFRESVYHIPFAQVQVILDRYSKYLKSDGVFIVRLYASSQDTGKTKGRVASKLDLIRREFDVLENYEHTDTGRSTVLVFRPRRKS
jgi:SAM-dependent methyltransferase